MRPGYVVIISIFDFSGSRYPDSTAYNYSARLPSALYTLPFSILPTIIHILCKARHVPEGELFAVVKNGFAAEVSEYLVLN